MTVRRSLAAVTALALSACATPPSAPGPVAPRQSGVSRPAQAQPPRPVDGSWSFGVRQDVCSGSVAHPTAALTLSAGPRPTVIIGARGAANAPAGAGRIVNAAFSGPDGSWEQRFPRGPQPTASASAPLDDASEGKIRALIGGGTLRLVRENAQPLALTVPDAGVAGRDWFGCIAQLRAE